jgi:hypothetical protein
MRPGWRTCRGHSAVQELCENSAAAAALMTFVAAGRFDPAKVAEQPKARVVAVV